MNHTIVLSEKLSNILYNIAENTKQVPFWQDYSFWLALLSFIALAITLFYLIQYTRATEFMMKYQILPAFDLNMIFEKEAGKTYFWFDNESNFPGIVCLESKKNNGERKILYQPLRIPPKRKMKTATNFDLSQVEGDRVTIFVLIKPALEKTNIKFEFEKSYKFTGEKWNETSWDYPDLPFPAANKV